MARPDHNDIRRAYFLDFLANPLEIGDRVVFIRPGYRELCTGIVKAFTPKMVRISITSPNIYQKEIVQVCTQMVKVEGVSNGDESSKTTS